MVCLGRSYNFHKFYLDNSWITRPISGFLVRRLACNTYNLNISMTLYGKVHFWYFAVTNIQSKKSSRLVEKSILATLEKETEILENRKLVSRPWMYVCSMYVCILNLQSSSWSAGSLSTKLQKTNYSNRTFQETYLFTILNFQICILRELSAYKLQTASLKYSVGVTFSKLIKRNIKKLCLKLFWCPFCQI